MKCSLLEIQGYLRNEFITKNHDEEEYFSSITDGKKKIDIIVSKQQDENISFERGTKLEIIGDLQESGDYL